MKGGQSKIKSKEDDSGNETEDRYFHLMPNFVTYEECVRVRESWRSKGPCAPFDKYKKKMANFINVDP